MIEARTQVNRGRQLPIRHRLAGKSPDSVPDSIPHARLRSQGLARAPEIPLAKDAGVEGPIADRIEPLFPSDERDGRGPGPRVWRRDLLGVGAVDV